MDIRRGLLFFTALACTAASAASSVGSFLVTNNDVPLPNPPMSYSGSTVSFYSIGANGSLGDRVVVATGGDGVDGGFFASSRVAIVPQGEDVCVFASNAATADIAGISATAHAVTGNYSGSATDAGTANGIGLAANANHLYATFSSSSTIATFTIRSGCTLGFVGDIFTVGLNGGLVSGLAIHGPTLITTYGDGSIESFNISAGIPVANGDAQNSTGFAHDHLPNGVDITSDGHYAIFGDASTVTTLEVSDISSGELTPTVAYDLGAAWNSGSVRLSPDETLLFVTNNSGGRVSAAFFDRATGRISAGCTSAPLRGLYSSWSYAGAAALQLPTAQGGLLYVPEFGANGFSSIGIVELTSTGTSCRLTETASSPSIDNADSSDLLSIAVYPARPF
jgi:hypothetical protein